MGKSLYLLKMYIVLSVFTGITPVQIMGLNRLVTFIICIYGRKFLSNSTPAAAPLNDHRMYYDLQLYKSIDSEISRKGIETIKRHLWYLTPEMVVMALFDNGLTLDQKQLMATTLVSYQKPTIYPKGKPGHPGFKHISKHLTATPQPLSVFLNENSWLLFHHASQYIKITQPRRFCCTYHNYRTCLASSPSSDLARL